MAPSSGAPAAVRKPMREATIGETATITCMATTYVDDVMTLT